MVRILQLRCKRVGWRPVRPRISPLDLARQVRLAVGVNGDLVPRFVERSREVGNEELGSPVARGRDSDEGRTDEPDVHVLREMQKQIPKRLGPMRMAM